MQTPFRPVAAHDGQLAARAAAAAGRSGWDGTPRAARRLRVRHELVPDAVVDCTSSDSRCASISVVQQPLHQSSRDRQRRRLGQEDGADSSSRRTSSASWRSCAAMPVANVSRRSAQWLRSLSAVSGRGAGSGMASAGRSSVGADAGVSSSADSTAAAACSKDRPTCSGSSCPRRSSSKVSTALSWASSCSCAPAGAPAVPAAGAPRAARTAIAASPAPARRGCRGPRGVPGAMPARVRCRPPAAGPPAACLPDRRDAKHAAGEE